jgi:hypothetical protein
MAIAIVESSAVSKKIFDPTLKEQAYDSCAVTKLLKARDHVIDGGLSIQWAYRYQQLGRTNAVGPRQQRDFASKQTRLGQDIPWEYYDGDTMVHRDEWDVNRGKGRTINLLGEKHDELRQDLQQRVADDTYTTNPNGLGVVSLKDIVGTGALYGVDPADATPWKSFSVDTTTTVLALYGPNSLKRAIDTCEFQEDGVTHIVTTKNIRSKIESWIQSLQRYVDRDEETAKIGFKNNIRFGGAIILADHQCPAGDIFGLDLDNLEMVHMSDFGPYVSDWQGLGQAGFEHAMYKAISLVWNYRCWSRRTNFLFDAIDEDA